jgi:tRNA1(Val) A37 N6-methylase TrmN6
METTDLTDDAFLGGRISVLQPSRGYRSGLDAVLLAAACPIKAGDTASVLDAGAGVGVVGLAIAARVAGADVTMVERDAELAEVAHANIERNGFGGRARVVMADISAGGRVLHDPLRPSALAPARFEHLVTNPPFYATGSGTHSSHPIKAGAHQMAGSDLDRWVAFLATAGVADATLTLIHRADAIGLVLAVLDGRFGRIRILPVHPREAAAASRVLVSAVKGSRARLELRPGLVLQDVDGKYLPAVDGVLRHGAAINI